MSNLPEGPLVVRNTLLSCQVCVPKDWTDEQAHEFVNRDNPSGTSMGWSICKEGSEVLDGAPERVACETRTEYVHIVFEC